MYTDRTDCWRSPQRFPCRANGREFFVFGASMNESVIARWDFSRTKQLLMDRGGMSQAEVDALEIEYKRYQIIRVLYPDQVFPISKPVDAFWHAHLLFSRDYQTMAAEAGHPLHHEPVITHEDGIRLAPLYFDTIDRYAENFGTPPPQYWPPNQECCCSIGWGTTTEQTTVALDAV